MGYIYILITLILTIYGQLILKWRLNFLGHLPDGFQKQFVYIYSALIDPYILSSFLAAFLASITWIAALTKFHLSYAYPFMSISFIAVLIMSNIFFNVPLTVNKIIGIVMITGGLIIASK
jgi:multidrug transporter EmrE-like cation transporter